MFTPSLKAIIQNVLLLIIALPAYEAAKQPHTPLETSDYVLFVAGLVINAIEFTADNQHQSFHKYKSTGQIDKNEWIGVNIQWTPEDAKRGFITKGLWAWSRHPNFACEQLCWVITEPTLHTRYSHSHLGSRLSSIFSRYSLLPTPRGTLPNPQPSGTSLLLWCTARFSWALRR